MGSHSIQKLGMSPTASDFSSIVGVSRTYLVGVKLSEQTAFERDRA